MRGKPKYATRIKYAGRDRLARGVRTLCGAGLNGTGRPALPPRRVAEVQEATAL